LSFEFLVLSWNSRVIWWGEATDEPRFGQRFLTTAREGRRRVGVQASACFIAKKSTRDKLKLELQLESQKIFVFFVFFVVILFQ
jgi:hypothetical protein